MNILIALSVFLILFTAQLSHAQSVDQLGIDQLKSHAVSEIDSIRFTSLKELSKRYLNIDRDSAYHYAYLIEALAAETKKPEFYAGAYLLLANIENTLGRYDSALSMYKKSLRYASKVEGLSTRIQYANLGALYRSLGRFDSSLFYFENALSQSALEGDKFTISKIHNNIGNLKVQTNDKIGGIEEYYKSVKLLDTLLQQTSTESIRQQYIRMKSTTLVNICNLHFRLKQVEQAKKIMDEILPITEELKPVGLKRKIQGRYYVLQARYHYRQGDLVESAESFKTALELKEKVSTIESLIDIYLNLATIYSELNKPQETLKYAEIGLEKLEGAKQLNEDYKEEKRISIYTTSIIPSYIMLKNFDKANNYLSYVEGCDQSRLSLVIKKDLHNDLQKIYASLGHFEKAYKSSNLFFQYSDSLSSDKTKKAVLEIETQYETEKKEQEIVSLQQEASIQSLELAKKNNQIIIGGLLALVLMVGSFLGYRQYKARRDKTSLELEQRFLRSQLNPHFIFNSMGAIQQYLLTESAEKASDYMSMFSRLMRQILENSREEFITIEEELSMLKNYLELQKLRFNNAFEYIIEVDDALDQEYDGIPPMFAQPFLENALEHGLFKKDESKLTIKFSKVSDDLIQLEILDSGVGITKQLSPTGDHKSLATKITNERLEKMRVTHKTDLSLNTENVINETGEIQGYRVSLNLPSKLVAA
ncbi:tetratricopeptide repeat-containing sensor histidine kinase [Ekhidna sp.]